MSPAGRGAVSQAQGWLAPRPSIRPSPQVLEGGLALGEGRAEGSWIWGEASDIAAGTGLVLQECLLIENKNLLGTW